MRSLIFIFIIAVSNLLAQTTIKTSVDTSIALVGDIINLSLEVQTTDSLRWPDIADQIRPLEVQQYNPIDTLYSEGVYRYSQNTFIQYFDTGLVYIPSLNFINTKGDTFFSDSIAIAFLGLKMDTTKAYFDIKAPKKIPFNFEEAKPYIYSLLLLILAVVIILYFIKKYRTKNEEVIPTKVEIPSNIEALDALKALAKKNLCEQGLAKDHYLKLSAILRHYFDREFDTDTMESTTDETIVLLKSNISDGELITKINQLLSDADLVKFAKVKLDSKTNKFYLDNAFQIVEACHILRKEGADV